MICLLGGTFDPVHNGHIYIAKEVMTAFSADKIIFIPNRNSPHRMHAIATPQQRADMVILAIKDYKNFEMSTVELERPGPSYMIDTVKTIKKFYPRDEMALILGSDAYSKFTTWLHWKSILDHCHLIVVNRGNDNNLSDKLINPDFVYTLQIQPCPISATQIRSLIAEGKPIDALVPEAVKNYILKYKLYTK